MSRHILEDNKQVADVKESISDEDFIAFDLETTGLDPTKDKVFAFAISYGDQSFYFSKQRGIDVETALVSLLTTTKRKLKAEPNKEKVLFAHNAIFDISFVLKLVEGKPLCIERSVVCTKETERLINSQVSKRSLNDTALRYGLPSKSDAVMEYIVKHELHDGTKKGKLINPRFDKVPDDIMAKYCMLDTELCYQIGRRQLDMIERAYYLNHIPERKRQVLYNEFDLPIILSNIKLRGVELDIAKLAYNEKECVKYRDTALRKLSQLAGFEFTDTTQNLKRYFTENRVPFPSTRKGNPSFTAKAILDSTIDEAFSTNLLQARYASKLLDTYIFKLKDEVMDYKNKYGFRKDNRHTVHPDFSQNGCQTGRFTCYNPPIQTFPSSVWKGISIRRMFVPRKGYKFYAFDYSQQEYRLFLDYIGEKKLIDKVNSGADFHEETAKLLGLDRKTAKCYNFAYLYGSGDNALAKTTGSSLEDVKKVRLHYEKIMPKAKLFIDTVKKQARSIGRVTNWAGRIIKVDPNECYKGVNYIIQSGGADIVKNAMYQVNQFLLPCNKYAGYDCHLVLNIHDELVYEIRENDASDDLAVKIKEIMEDAYNYSMNDVRMKVDITKGDSLCKEDLHAI